jgi:hypothetical protein
MYNAIFEAIRRDQGLASLDKDLFEGLKGHPAAADPLKWSHNTGHVCNSLIQLMQRVFYDLHLEDRDKWTHPYVTGWIDIFRYWVKTESFSHAWAVTRGSYPERFRAFYDELARGDKQGGEKAFGATPS